MRLNQSSDSNVNKKIEWFSRWWLLDVRGVNLGDSIEGVANIEITDEVLIENCNDPMNATVQETYADLLDNLTSNEYFDDRAILAPTIEMVAKTNDHMCSLLPSEL
ncbi:hypothetical protein K1719_040343 [Acacia pycnantha]|nr:hypothetical protein K1719_040343 [Acacia pycnantha]